MSLSAAVAGVRLALAKALSDAADQHIRLGVSSLDLEFHVEVLAGASDDAPAELRVVQPVADPGTAHRIKLCLQPVDLRNGVPDEVFIGEFTQDHS
ncbi:trypco2 family protein [Streptomyces antibioticus]|uniref:trypco2 family protein n=1 Tax=Streptomyces antibioticus TaxID=1890 RepID=UPI0036D880D5